MAISTIGTDALASAAVTSAKLASGAPSRSQLPAGTVLQVVYGYYATYASTTSTTYTDTGLTASITPTSATSKILVCVSLPLYKFAGYLNAAATANICRNGTNIWDWVNYALWNNISNIARGGYSTYYLDSPATTSSTAYKVQARCSEAGSGVGIGWCPDNSVASITLMEIAA